MVLGRRDGSGAEQNWRTRRRSKILAGLGDRGRGAGVEIGALDYPLLLKAEGTVHYVDFTDTESLRATYADYPDHDVSRIVEVDAVWGERSLAEALGERAPVDYVVASHVIEHVPDLLTWLEEIRAILKPGGTVHLAIPDRRYTFDFRRQDSRIADVVHAYLVKARRPLPQQVLDFEIHYMPVDARDAWSGRVQVPRLFDRQRVMHGLEVVREVIRTDVYLDVHCWVFTPLSFALLMEQLSALELVRFSCGQWFNTERDGMEFVVILKEGADALANAETWRRMAAALQPPRDR